MARRERIYVRSMRDSERDAVRDLTLPAYEEYSAIMPEAFWIGYRRHLRATLDAEGPAERIVAERQDAVVGGVLLFPPAANVYAGAAGGTEWPEVRLLIVLSAARGQGVGTALMAECVRRARRAGARALGLHTMDMMHAAMRMYEHGLRAHAQPRLQSRPRRAGQRISVGSAHMSVDTRDSIRVFTKTVGISRMICKITLCGPFVRRSTNWALPGAYSGRHLIHR